MTTLTAGATSTNGFKLDVDASGALVIKTGSGPTTALTIDSSGNFSLAASAGTKSSTITSTDTSAYYEAVGASGAGNVRVRLQANATTAQVGTLSAHQFNVQANSTDVLGIDKDKSLALQGASPQSGAGITFPATQSASSNVNTLDDYEEGSWTPLVYDGGNNRSPSYAFRSGSYTKIGNLVWIRLGLKLSNKGSGSGSGEIQIYGLPFTCVTTGAYQEPGTRVVTGALNTAGNAYAAHMAVATGAVNLFGRIVNNADTVWTYDDLTNDSWILLQLCYQTT